MSLDLSAKGAAHESRSTRYQDAHASASAACVDNVEGHPSADVCPRIPGNEVRPRCIHDRQRLERSYPIIGVAGLECDGIGDFSFDELRCEAGYSRPHRLSERGVFEDLRRQHLSERLAVVEMQEHYVGFAIDIEQTVAIYRGKKLH